MTSLSTSTENEPSRLQYILPISDLVVNTLSADHLEKVRVAASSVDITVQRIDNGFSHLSRLTEGVLEGFKDTIENVLL